jgi:hypothetical protein
MTLKLGRGQKEMKKMETRLKNIAFIWDVEHMELIIERDGFKFAIPRRNLYSLRAFVARVYRKGFYRRLDKKTKEVKNER